MRPMVKSALRRSWQDLESVRFGVGPEHAVTMEQVDRAGAAFLRLLDGTRSADTLVREAAALGVDPDRVRRMLAALAERGVLEDAGAYTKLAAALHHRGEVLDRLRPDLAGLSLVHSAPGAAPARVRERGASRVRVAGAGRVGAALAAVLAAAGVGGVDVADTGRVEPWDVGPAGFPTDQVGERRDAAARGVVRRAAGGRTGPPGGPRARPRATTAAAARPRGAPESGRSRDLDAQVGRSGRTGPVGSGAQSGADGPGDGASGDGRLTVLVPRDGLAAYAPEVTQARRLVASGAAHLYAGVMEGTGFVGPLVVPGRTACGECTALALADQDPSLPRVLAQLRSGGQPSVPACDIALATMVAGLAAGHVLAFLDGREPPSAGARVELSQSRLAFFLRPVPPDPRCGCGAARRAGRVEVGAATADVRREKGPVGAADEGPGGKGDGHRGGSRVGGCTMAMDPTGNEGAHV